MAADGLGRPVPQRAPVASDSTLLVVIGRSRTSVGDRAPQAVLGHPPGGVRE
jgi:hypothetical protein